jgi:hypothetical protein
VIRVTATTLPFQQNKPLSKGGMMLLKILAVGAIGLFFV